jgi:hypothetical protein
MVHHPIFARLQVGYLGALARLCQARLWEDVNIPSLYQVSDSSCVCHS